MLLRISTHAFWPLPASKLLRVFAFTGPTGGREQADDNYLRAYTRSFAAPLVALAVALGVTLLLAASLLPSG